MPVAPRIQRSKIQPGKDARLDYMDPLRHGRPSGRRDLRYLALAAALALAGCASPGPPQAPSLHLPQPVSDLTVQRIGDTVQLHFTAPSQSTDKMALRGSIPGEFCRQLPQQKCIAVPSSKVSIQAGNSGDQGQSQGVDGSAAAKTQITWIDKLPPKLASGPVRLLTYRVEFFSLAQRSAGLSNPAYTATGPAPAPVTGLRALGTRLGILLRWNPAPPAKTASSSGSAQVVLQREDLSPVKPHAQPKAKSKPQPPAKPDSQSKTKSKGKSNTKSKAKATAQPAPASKPARPNVVWLQANATEASNGQAGGENSEQTLDTSVQPDRIYRYTAERRFTLHLPDTEGMHQKISPAAVTVQLRSAPSTPVVFTLLQIFPPPPPTGLTVAAYFNPTPSGTPSSFAVDLIWQPIDATGLMTPLAGYNVYRQRLDAGLHSIGASRQINTAPLPTPAFHDDDADPTATYRYAVTAIDIKGNESPSVTTLLEPTRR
ncbi:MAG: hypothetical protein ACLGQU_02670 [Acidobacteriota bacterium]